MSASTNEEINAAFREFAAREMPWLLEDPEDDSECLQRSVAKIAFARGFQAGQTTGPQPGEALQVARSAVREKLEPHLIAQFCGLRRHQVTDAIGLLLDYIDASAQPATI